MSDDLEDGGPEDLGEVVTSTPEKAATRKKIMAVVLSLVIIIAGIGVWYFQFRAWSIEEVSNRVVGSQYAPGFDESLAGRTITIAGRVTKIESYSTTFGLLSRVELDDFNLLTLVEWGDLSIKVGDSISREVHFEWGHFNDVHRVFSQQLDFPVIVPAISIPTVMESVGCNSGICMVPRDDTSSNAVIIELFLSSGGAFPLGLFNATLGKGVNSWTMEYIDVSKRYRDRPPVDFLASLEDGAGQNNNMTFVDANSNGMLDDHDYFETYLTRPSADSSVLTYLLTVNNLQATGDSVLEGICYIVMTNEGVFRISNPPEFMANPYHFGRLQRISEYEASDGITTEIVVTDVWGPPLSIDESGCRLMFEYYSPILECSNLVDGVVAIRGNISITFTDSDRDGYLNGGDYFIVNGLENWTEYTLGVIIYNGTQIGFKWTTGIGAHIASMPVIEWKSPAPLDQPTNRLFKIQIDRMYGIPGLAFDDPDRLMVVDLHMDGIPAFSARNLTEDFNNSSSGFNLTFIDADENGFINSGDYFICNSTVAADFEIVLGYVHRGWEWPPVTNYQWSASWQTG
jgi:hypothetical protein